MNEEKNIIREKDVIVRFMRRIQVGIQIIQRKRIFRQIGIVCLMCSFTMLMVLCVRDLTGGVDALVAVLDVINCVICFIIGIGFVIYIISRPLTARKIESSLIEVGVTDAVGLPPLFQYAGISDIYEGANEYYFFCKGIALSVWQDKKEQIETALNLHILDIVRGVSEREVVIYATSGDEQMPEYLLWDWNYATQEPYSLVCGMSYGALVKISLKDTPHILLAGSTGSGKSQLLKLLMAQTLYKDCMVFIADFKGGIDFGRFWIDHTSILTEIDEVILLLEDLVITEIPFRKNQLLETETANIDEYNSRAIAGKMKRIIFACDEVAELLDKTGAAKEQKEKILRVEGYLSTIARLGRALGIHLFLAMQRPDANVLSGQIKNNIDGRICGKCEDTLSMIVLDNTDASRQIPKKEHGLFINQAGIRFRAFLLSDDYR